MVDEVEFPRAVERARTKTQQSTVQRVAEIETARKAG